MRIEVGAHKMPLNNLGKELWRALDSRRGLTKRDLVVYLAGVSPLLHWSDAGLTAWSRPNR